jgi:hypothetical protein
MTKTATTTAAVCITLLAILFLPTTPFVMSDSDTFSASVTVSNAAPTVFPDLGQTIVGATGQTITAYLFFNATDLNSNSDLNDSTAEIRINQTGSSDLVSTGCVVDSSPDGNTNRYNCSVSVPYYTSAGTWTINATIEDDSGNRVSNTSTTLSINTLDAVAIVSASISFSGGPGTNNIAASPNPQQLNNTGNVDYTSINLTAFTFQDGANFIGVGNVTVNTSNSGGNGQTLTNNSPITITDASLSAGAVAVEDIYFWLDIPVGQAEGSYAAQSAWILEAE